MEVGEWVATEARIGSPFTWLPDNFDGLQPKLHRVVAIDGSGRILRACHRSVDQNGDTWLTPAVADDRPKCRLCARLGTQGAEHE